MPVVVGLFVVIGTLLGTHAMRTQPPLGMPLSLAPPSVSSVSTLRDRHNMGHVPLESRRVTMLHVNGEWERIADPFDGCVCGQPFRIYSK